MMRACFQSKISSGKSWDAWQDHLAFSIWGFHDIIIPCLNKNLFHPALKESDLYSSTIKTLSLMRFPILVIFRHLKIKIMNRSFYIPIVIISVSIFLSNSCINNEQKPNQISSKDQSIDIDTHEYLQKGKEMAQATGNVLAKQLLAAIETKGTHKALEFCNIEAIPLTDSMSLELNTKIKRVSDKNRNPDNAANEQELQYILQAKTEIGKNGKAKPKIFETNSKVTGYYPIMTNALCLQCHGNFGTDINEETRTAIKENYPEDKATGYSLNELRGVWVIEIDE